MSAILGQISSHVAEYLGLEPEEIASGSRLVEDLGIDSIDAAEIIDRIERSLGVNLADATLEQNASLEALAEHVERVRAEAANDGGRDA
jgi:acyl carrier protein